MCEAILQTDREVYAILEFWRKDPSFSFEADEEEIASSYLVWGGIALHYSHLFNSMNDQKKLNEFLLVVVK